MAIKTERAEAGTRIKMTELERSTYTGIARHPLARNWMLTRLAEARNKAEKAKTEQAVERWNFEVDRIGGELRRCGIDTGRSK